MQRLSPTANAYLVALVLGPAGVVLVETVESPWRGLLAAVIYIMPVILAAWLGGTRPGIVATCVVIAANVPFNWDRLDTSRRWTNYGVSVSIYLVIGVLLSWLIAALQSARRRAESELQVRKDAEGRAHDERERLQVTLASIGDAVIVTDTSGNVTFMNPVAAGLTRWQPEEAVGKPLEQIFRIVNERTRQPVESPVSRVLREGVIVGLANHTVLIAKNGSEIPIDDSGAPIRGKGGTLVGVVLVFRDVTEARRAIEDRLHLAAIVESSDDAIISKNLDGIITSWNRGAERLFGYTAQEMIGKRVSVLIPPNHPDELPKILKRIRLGEQVDHFETQRVCKDGRLVDVSLTISPMRNAEGDITGASKVARDITASKEADRRKNEFLALLAHELRNPLAPLRNGLEVMKLARHDADLVEQTRTMMERQLHQLGRLVDDLLDVSRISRGSIELRKERIALAEVVEIALETCAPLIQQDEHQLTVKLPDQPVYVDGDKIRLAQVLSNLLSNAAKYTERGGQIWVTVERQGDEAMIRVKDTGIGIPVPRLGEIFDLFTQINSPLEKGQTGIGVGLTIVKRLVEMHGGSVEARSEGHGTGSEFLIRLPTAPPIADEPAQRRADQPGPCPRHRILVVDDNVDAARSLGVMLKILGNEVRTAHDGAEAVELAGQFRPDVILLDLGMPKLNGYDACRHIREQSWGKKPLIVALTGWGQDEDRQRTEAAGFNRHLIKPVEPATLRKLLSEFATEIAGT